MTDEFLAVDLNSFVRSVEERWKRLASAEELVTISPDVLGGTPVIKGTRVPVHDVAASVETGIPKARILAAYPGLTAEQVDLAALYAHYADGREVRHACPRAPAFSPGMSSVAGKPGEVPDRRMPEPGVGEAG